MIKLRCIKTLYKSTYKGNAFTRNKLYELAEEDENRLFLIDKEGRRFSFAKHYYKQNIMYHIEDYFDPNPVNIRLVLIEKTSYQFNFKKTDYENKQNNTSNG